MKAVWIAIASTLLLTSCERPPCTSDPLLSIEAQVYEAVVTHPRFMALSWWDRRPLVQATLEPTESVLGRPGTLGLAQLGAEASTVAAVVGDDAGSTRVPTDLRESACVEVVDDPTRVRGNRFARLSRIGFNEARTEAIVLAINDCGGLCSHGDVFLLRRIDNRWRVVSHGNTWIS